MAFWAELKMLIAAAANGQIGTASTHATDKVPAHVVFGGNPVAVFLFACTHHLVFALLPH